MVPKLTMTTTIVVVFIVLFSTIQIFSIPNFARKYHMDCSACHNPVPRLNEYGFKFRAAGFRLPDQEIGKDASSDKMSDYLGGRIQANYNVKSSETPAGVTTNSNSFTFNEFTLYPIAGSFGKYLSSFVELSFIPDEAVEIENAYARVTLGQENSYFTVRAGIFHPFEGYGASDRPLGLSRPLFQVNKALNTQFKPWGYDQAGVEVGYNYNNTFIRATVFNGILASGEPAQGGGLVKAKTDPSFNSKDIQIFATQILTDNGGGISGYFYNGYVDLPTLSSTPYQNNYNRFAIYASYPLQKAVLMGGYQKGQDDYYDKTLNKVNSTFNSNGWFGEADYGINDELWLGLRYAQFDPSEKLDDNKVNNVTGVVNYSFNNGLQLIGEYNYKSSEQGVNLKQKDNSFEVRMIYIY